MREGGERQVMGRTEERVWKFLIAHRLQIFIACVTLLSLYARFSFRGFVSEDMRDFLLPWYDEIRELGGLKALSVQVGNYQISYQTLISVMTYLPISPVYAYKGLSVLFDYGMGIAAGAVVQEITESREKAALSYAAVVCLPVTVLNSAAWGQCDSIFTFFLILTFLFLIREKPTAAFLCYGMAFAFKLQAIFFLPFLLFYYVWSRKFSGWRFLLIPVPILLLSLGGMVQGRSLEDIVMIYVEQGKTFEWISLNYPSFWNLLVKNMAEEGADHYAELSVLCVMETIAVLGAMMIWLVRKKRMGRGTLLTVSVLMMYTCLLLLPSMHERYGYPVLIFTIMTVLLYPRVFPAAVGMLMIDMQTYGLFLMEKETLPWDFLVMMNVACFLMIAGFTWKIVCDEQAAIEDFSAVLK